MQTALRKCCIIGRYNNVVRVDFGGEPDPPAPRFPGAAGMRQSDGSENAEPHLFMQTILPIAA